MANVFPVIRVADISNSFSYLKSDLALRFIMPAEKEPEKVMAIRSRLFEAIEESGCQLLYFQEIVLIYLGALTNLSRLSDSWMR